MNESYDEAAQDIERAKRRMADLIPESVRDRNIRAKVEILAEAGAWRIPVIARTHGREHVLTLQEAFVFAILLDAVKDDYGGEVFPTVQNLAAASGLCQRTINRILKDLETKGWITAVRPHLGLPNWYAVHWPAEAARTAHELRQHRSTPPQETT